MIDDEYAQICDMLGMHTPYRVYFEDFAYYMSDGTNDVIIGYADDDLELLLSNSNRAFSELETMGSDSWF